MKRRLSHITTPSTSVLIAVGTGASLLAGFATWPHQPLQAVAFAGLMLLAIVVAILDPWRTGADDRSTMPPGFVLDMMALLLFGSLAMTIVALSRTIADAVTGSRRSYAIRRAAVNIAAAAGAAQVAAFVYVVLGDALGEPAWPWQAAPIGAAVIAYSLIRMTTADVIVPLCTGRKPSPYWLASSVLACASHIVGASVAVAVVEIVNHQLWNILPLVSVPVYLVYRAYSAYGRRSDGERRLRTAMESDERAITVVDHDGRVKVWNHAAARLVGCPRERALGRPLVDVVPALRQTKIPSTIEAALKNNVEGEQGLIANVDGRVLKLEMLPDIDGLALLWCDLTEQTRTEQSMKRSAERLALAAEGANDGLWEWDLRTNELYTSPRWRAMVGLPEGDPIGRREDWFDRVHAEDRAPLKEALDAHFSGLTDHFQHEHRMRQADGTYRPFLCRGMAVLGAGQRPARIAGSLTDITGAVAQERARSMRFRDPLTGLSNRAVFADGLGRRLADLKKGRGARFAVLYLDLDRFKVVNDSLGHLVGDELLTAVSRRLESCLRHGDALARLGGDEFAILLNGLGDEMQANAIALRMQHALAAPFSIGDREVFTSASIGIAFSRPEYMSPEEIMRDADTAMYQAKTRGKARHEVFDADMHASALDRLGLESDLRRAIQSNAFEVHYQPIVTLSTGMCTGFEALVRWKRNGAAVSPARFIPIAEELGLIEPLGKWVLQEACRTFAGWRLRFPDNRLDCITVNVSTRQLIQRGFLQLVKQVVHETGMRPQDLRLEITETALMEGPALAAQVLRDVREFGVKIYLDDFGTGYSSLSHLHKLPVDALKIDRSFVRSMLLDDGPAIVESILALACTLKTGVVAEGVESEFQARELERLGCRHAQGYFFSPPIPVPAVEKLLTAAEPLGGAKTASLAAAS